MKWFPFTNTQICSTKGFGPKTKPTKEYLIPQKSARREGLNVGHFLTTELWGLISNTTIAGMATQAFVVLGCVTKLRSFRVSMVRYRGNLETDEKRTLTNSL